MQQTVPLPYSDLLREGPVGEPTWLADQRSRMADAFAATGFPTGKEEMWLGYDRALAKERPLAVHGTVTESDLRPVLPGAARIVLIDGVLAPESTTDLPEGVRVLDLQEAARADDEVARVHTGACLGEAPGDPFSQLNGALWTGGLLVDVQPGTTLDRPLHILHVRTGVGANGSTVAFPRVVIHVQEDASAQVLEEAFQAGTGEAHTLAVTELALHPGAGLRHTVLHDEGPAARRVHAVYARGERDSRLHHTNVSWGGASVRQTLIATLAEAGAHATLHGLTLTRDTQRVDAWTRVDHAVADTTSDEVYKSILDGKSRSRFTGNVLVRPDAQRVASTQENRNLLLSRGALAESTPQLEIHADDVQCSHGSTVGRLDDEALFFLRSRGIGADEAVVMLSRAFAGQVTTALEPEALREAIGHGVTAWFDARHASPEEGA